MSRRFVDWRRLEAYATLFAVLSAPVTVLQAQAARFAASSAIPSRAGRAPTTRSLLLVENAAPASFQVVSVEVPPDLRAERELRYEILSSNARILGAREGVIKAAMPRELLITMQVPADALAGRNAIAEVVFTASGVSRTTAVEMNIRTVRRTSMMPLRDVYGARAGEHLRIPFSITNTGNAADTLQLRATAPDGWNVQFAERDQVILPPGGSLVTSIRVAVPAGIHMGEGRVGAIVLAHGDERARASSRVAVARGDLRVNSVLMATTSITSLRGDDGAQYTGTGLTLRGALSEHLQLDARISHIGSTVRGGSDRQVALQPYAPASNVLTLSAPSWTIQAGSVGVTTSELTGQFVAGMGGAIRLGSERSGVQVIAARPWSTSAMRNSSRVQVAARAAYGSKRAGVSLSAVRLEDATWLQRKLDAVAAGVWFAPSTSLHTSVETGQRWYEGGRGTGIASNTQLTRTSTRAELRLLHTPGGIRAYASAGDAAFGQITHSFGKALTVNADGWITSQDGGGTDRQHSSGWGLTPELRVTRRFTVTPELRAIQFAMQSPTGAVAYDQQLRGLRAQLQLGALRFGSQAAVTEGMRTLGTTVLRMEEPMRRSQLRGDAVYEGRLGMLRIQGGWESPSGWRQGQGVVGVSVDRLRVIPWWSAVTVSGSDERIMYGTHALDVFRGAVNVALARGARLQLGVQQDGAVRGGAGSRRPSVFVRFEQSASIRVPGIAQTHGGVVYQDFNTNQRRDAGEPGMPGVLVRRGVETSVTDTEGRYHFPSGTGDVQLDSRSLASGWMASSARTSSRDNTPDLPVVATGQLDVSIGLRDGASSVTLGSVAVIIADVAGRTWVIRTGADGIARVDALPLGHYTVRAEADESSEPLVMSGPVRVDLTPAQPRARVEIGALRRPMRLYQNPTGGQR